ncbi:alpha/beta fold hydrolase [Sphaerisporangium corydalis]|uniref:Alpha/beta fold hydrolase n=1 Tax=Sphaerisporangium corydalis TaxID=1441875 RepID=A0ABV9E7C1_9ACTN|nr:alpha/beta hydrolase [Sphaerisporangium corydalis]
MAFADVDGVRLFYTDDTDDAGDGAPGSVLLLVHGWGSDSHEWSHHIPALRKKHRVIAVDLRGHGHSSCRDTGNVPRRMAADLAELLAGLGTGPVVAVGHSMGGQVVSHLAVEHPGTVRALVAVDPGYGFGGPVAANFPAMVAALRGGDANAVAVGIDQWSYTPATPPLLREWHRRRTLATPPHVLVEAFEEMFAVPGAIGVRPHSDDFLARRDCPVLSFWFDPGQAAWESGLFKDPRSRTVVWEGSGHRLHEERPAEFLLVVNKWLKALAGARA